MQSRVLMMHVQKLISGGGWRSVSIFTVHFKACVGITGAVCGGPFVSPRLRTALMALCAVVTLTHSPYDKQGVR